MNKKVRTVLNDKNLNEASKILKLHVSNENQMTQLARILAPLLPQTGVLLINGIMGSGKTFLCRNFIQAKQENEKKYVEDIPSPTFTLVQTYSFENSELWHCDFYRIKTASELLELGLEEAFENALCLIEWPKWLDNLEIFDVANLEIKTGQNINERELIFFSKSEKWKAFSKKFESIKF